MQTSENKLRYDNTRRAIHLAMRLHQIAKRPAPQSIWQCDCIRLPNALPWAWPHHDFFRMSCIGTKHRHLVPEVWAASRKQRVPRLQKKMPVRTMRLCSVVWLRGPWITRAPTYVAWFFTCTPIAALYRLGGVKSRQWVFLEARRENTQQLDNTGMDFTHHA
jgi:hypothetical protein